jgi:hypothetical protein
MIIALVPITLAKQIQMVMGSGMPAKAVIWCGTQGLTVDSNPGQLALAKHDIGQMPAHIIAVPIQSWVLKHARAA